MEILLRKDIMFRFGAKGESKSAKLEVIIFLFRRKLPSEGLNMLNDFNVIFVKLPT